MMTRKEQKEKRRQDILIAALDIFIKKGFGATKITDIAEKVHMSNGLLFHYFPSKASLYHELVSIGIKAMKQKIEFDHKNPLDSLQAFIEELLNRIEEENAVAKIFVLVDQAQYLEIIPEETKSELAESQAFIKRTSDMIRIGQENQTIREGDPEALSIAFWSAIQGYAQHKAQDSSCPKAEAEWFIDILRYREED